MARLWLTLLMVAVIVVVFLLMWSGWRHRATRQRDITRLIPAPGAPADATWIPAVFVGVTRAGDWLERVVVHTLDVPGEARVAARPEGVWVLRDNGDDLFLSRQAIRAVRYDNAIAGKVLEKNGLLILTWDHDGVLLDVGLRIRDPYAAESLRQTLQGVPS